MLLTLDWKTGARMTVCMWDGHCVELMYHPFLSLKMGILVLMWPSPQESSPRRTRGPLLVGTPNWRRLFSVAEQALWTWCQDLCLDTGLTWVDNSVSAIKKKRVYSVMKKRDKTDSSYGNMLGMLETQRRYLKLKLYKTELSLLTILLSWPQF